jgi:hypothetical protein
MRILLLATMLTLAACGSQPPPKSVDEINQLVGIAEKAIGVTQKIHAGAPDADVQAAMQELFTALDTARNQTEDIMRQVAAGKYLGRHSIDPMDDVSVCVGAHLAEVSSLEQMSPTTVSLWTLDVGRCAVYASTYYQSVSANDGAAAALAVSIIYPVTLAAHAKAGRTSGSWLRHYLSINENIITRLEPQCGEKKNTASGADEPVRYECAAYAVAMVVRPKLQALATQMPTSP